MSERALQDAIAATAQLLEWRIFHPRAARTAKGWRTAGSYQAEGYPDLTLVRDRVLWVEVKTERGRLRPEQELWLEVLRGAGQEVHLWRPAEWTSGATEDVLRSPRTEAAA